MSTTVPVIYSVNNCPQCEHTKNFFKAHGTEYKEVNITEDEQKRAEFRDKGMRSAPVVEFGSELWSGFRLDKIQQAIASTKCAPLTA